MASFSRIPVVPDLAQDDVRQLPMPANTVGGQFASVCVGRNAFLALTGRCGICAHRLQPGRAMFVIWCLPEELAADGFEVDHAGQWIGRTPPTPGTSATSYSAAEGLLHPHCLSLAADLCPFLLVRGREYQTVNDNGPAAGSSWSLPPSQ